MACLSVCFFFIFFVSICLRVDTLCFETVEAKLGSQMTLEQDDQIKAVLTEQTQMKNSWLKSRQAIMLDMAS